MWKIAFRRCKNCGVLGPIQKMVPKNKWRGEIRSCCSLQCFADLTSPPYYMVEVFDTEIRNGMPILGKVESGDRLKSHEVVDILMTTRNISGFTKIFQVYYKKPKILIPDTVFMKRFLEEKGINLQQELERMS